MDSLPVRVFPALLALGVLFPACSGSGSDAQKAATNPASRTAPEELTDERRGESPATSEAGPRQKGEGRGYADEDKKPKPQEESESLDRGDAAFPQGAPLPAQDPNLPTKPSVDGKLVLAEDLAAIEADLAKLESQMRAAGIPMPSDEALSSGQAPARFKASSAIPSNEPLDCKKACELTDAICTLADSICEMRDRHAGDERYARACERATSDCAFGGQACTSCEAQP